MDYIIDHMKDVNASDLADDAKHSERLILVLYLQDAVQDHPRYAAGIDELTRKAGLEPRTLLSEGTSEETRGHRSFAPSARLLWKAE